jgi:AcrR family transcriptional regulator
VTARVRQRLSSAERQDEIIKAAVELAGREGMDNVTTQGIADAIGVTQGAIFRHFPTKDAIWISVVHWARGRLMGVVDMAASQASNPLEAVEKIFFAHIGFADKYPALPRVLLSANPHLKQIMKEMLAGYEERIAAFLSAAKTLSLVRRDLDESDAATLFIAMVQGLVMHVLILRAKKSLIGEARRVFPIYMAGIGARSLNRKSAHARQ